MALLVLDDDLVRAHAGEADYARGLEYQRHGAVTELSVGATAADAAVADAAVADAAVADAAAAGTYRCRVHLEPAGDGLSAECSCPLGAEGTFCAHAAAVALAWLDAAGIGGVAVPGDVVGPGGVVGPHRSKPDLAAFLGGQPTAWLVERLLRFADADPVVRAEWEALAAESLAGGPDLRGFRRRMERALTVSGYLGWEDVGEYLDAAYEVLSLIEEMLGRGLAVSAVELAEEALRLVESAADAVEAAGEDWDDPEREWEDLDEDVYEDYEGEDEDGGIVGVLAYAQELHLRACRAARPDPVALADRLTRWAIDSDRGVFGDAAEDYADVYGDAGLQRYREVVTAEWASLPALAPGRSGGYSRRRVVVEHMRLSFAETAEEEAEVLGRNLSTPDRLVTVSRLLAEAGRFDDALRLLRQGQAAFASGYGREQVDQAVADTLRDAGRGEEAAEVEWDCFRRQPGLRSFIRFAEHMRPRPAWERWRAKALALLERPAEPGSWPAQELTGEHGNSGLVEVLLWDGDVEAAWAAAQRGGCTGGRWLDVARARAATHPQESIPVLVRTIDAARSKASSRSAYSEVASLLVELRDWHRRAGTDAAFADYLLRIRTYSRNRPAFQDELDRAGLP